MDLIWWIILALLLLVLGIVTVVRWVLKGSRSGYRRIKNRRK